MNTQNRAPNFITEIIDADIAINKNQGKVHTRFPPEPNGYLHIGHAKSICLNFGLAKQYNGLCNLRFDDTNPETEDVEYVDSIKEDIKWLGFSWDKREYYASDYFQKLYDYAIELIKKEKAYVCELSPEEFKEYRGTVTSAGHPSPHRSRSVDENLDLFRRMKDGEFPDGSRVLRAKIDMASPNMLMRDPAIFRIKKAPHHRTANKWCIYPMYDFAHCLSDSTEGITHSICTLEFENNRQLYDWILNQLGVHHPQQIEFARLNISNTVLSKRKLKQLVDEKYVSGWNDPRMPTLSGLRRRGATPEAIRNFCDEIGVTKIDGIIDMVVLENSIRQDLNKNAQRVMVVLNPLKVVITNYPESKTEELDAINNPEDPSAGTRKVSFSRVLYIEKEDFMGSPVKGFFRLSPGKEVRLRYAYFLKCTDVIKDAKGEIVQLNCTYDPNTKGGDAPDGRKVKATLHWVSAGQAAKIEARLYDYLFTKRNPDEDEDFKMSLNPNSLKILKDCMAEPALLNAKKGERFQFERQGYFCVDTQGASDVKLVFNRIVTLRDSWAKQAKKL